MKNSNVQDVFLNQLRKERIPVTIYTTNGFQLRGAIAAFDNFTLILQDGNKQNLLYKHAISTIVPIKSVNLQP